MPPLDLAKSIARACRLVSELVICGKLGTENLPVINKRLNN